MNQEGAGTILVGVDGSEVSIEALRHAQRLAIALGAGVVAVTCWEVPAVYDGFSEMDVRGFEDSARKLLDDSVVKAFGDARPGNVSARLLFGPARQSLVDASRRAAMLVVGRRGRGGFAGLQLGSVSSACVAHAECPVLVIHAPRDGYGRAHGG